MKQILKTFLFTASLAIVLFACEKVEPLVVYKNGVTAKLQASATTIAPKVTDSLTPVVTFNWTNPQYATDSSTVKYVIQIDSSGRNFSKAASVVLTNKSSHSMIAKDLNAILLNMGFKYNTAYKVDVRLVTSYANNNEQLASNVLTLTVTPYVVPPKVTPPASKTLFLVGDATAGGWDNPTVPNPTQQFTRVDSVTYQGKFYLIAGKQYLALPVHGSWTNKYSVANNNAFGLAKGGDFGYNLSDNFPGPAVTGIYIIKFDFQAGKFTVTLDKDYAFLYVPGEYQSWSPATAPTLASPAKDGKFNGFVYFNAASKFKLTNQPDWAGTAYGVGAAGKMSSTGGDLSVASAGHYLINANTVNNDYSAVRTTWGVVGAFSGWGGSADTQLTYSNGKWTGTLVLAAESELKFRANSGWDINMGDDGGDGVLEFGGANLKFGAGTYKVELNLSNAGYYTYSFIKQ
jgi:hypothetical protein